MFVKHLLAKALNSHTRPSGVSKVRHPYTLDEPGNRKTIGLGSMVYGSPPKSVEFSIPNEI